MVTLQEQFEKDFPDKEVKEICFSSEYGCVYGYTKFTSRDLDLSQYMKLEEFRFK